jgi:hypothetical protein
MARPTHSLMVQQEQEEHASTLSGMLHREKTGDGK